MNQVCKIIAENERHDFLLSVVSQTQGHNKEYVYDFYFYCESVHFLKRGFETTFSAHPFSQFREIICLTELA